MGKEIVLQDWVKELSWKQQSVVLSSLRGPDNYYFPNIKKISRWIRRSIQNDADPSSQYMKDEILPSLMDFKKDIEFCSVHYLNHLLQGLEIIGYYHPDEKISMTTKELYGNLVTKILHLNPETKNQLEDRLKDLD